MRLAATVLFGTLLLASAPASFGAEPSPCPAAEMSDARDGVRYPLMAVGDGCWFASNLRVSSTPSYCYDDDPRNCERFGRLYPWEIALAACPAGWHLATEYDWQNLEQALGVAAADLEKTRARGDPAGDRFKALHGERVEDLYAGWRRPDGKFSSRGQALGLWVANEADRDLAWHRDINVKRAGIYRSEVNKPYALSVRCVKNYYETDPTWKPAPNE